MKELEKMLDKAMDEAIEELGGDLDSLIDNATHDKCTEKEKIMAAEIESLENKLAAETERQRYWHTVACISLSAAAALLSSTIVNFLILFLTKNSRPGYRSGGKERLHGDHSRGKGRITGNASKRAGSPGEREEGEQDCLP